MLNHSDCCFASCGSSWTRQRSDHRSRPIRSWTRQSSGGPEPWPIRLQPTRISRPAITILFVFALLLATNADSSGAERARQPNVLVILTDDQGWGDLSVHGNTNLSTPHIDSLARDGVSFENFYVCQVCAPTRAEFLTARYYPRTGVSGVSTGAERLNPDETTIADLFRKAGYATGAFGKWHNGTQPPYHPMDRGFDEFYGFTSGHWGHYFSPPLDHNRETVRGEGFIVDDTTNHAIEFINEHAGTPFFCYVPFNTPHSPMMVPDRFYEKFDGRELSMQHRDPQREDVMMTRAALAMCENIDWNVGRLLGTIDSLGLREDTIVVYFSDNGPNSYRWNGGMKGRKASIEEGGLRVPCFVRWPGELPIGTSIQTIAGAIDLLPTLCELAGVDPSTEKSKDGRSLDSLLRGSTESWPPRLLFSIRNDRVSVRNQRFRLDDSGALFDITKDRGQHIDVSAKHPKMTANLSAAAERHRVDMKACFDQFADRPFTVGYGRRTVLPARDGVPHGSIRRSSKAPNNSFFHGWTDDESSITWDIDVGESGDYDAVVHYTCASGNEGVTLTLGTDGDPPIKQIVRDVYDPPLYQKSKERVAKSHYFVKDFKSLDMGTIRLTKGDAMLRLGSEDLQGPGVVDVHSLVLTRQ